MLLAVGLGPDGEIIPCGGQPPWDSFYEYMVSDGFIPFVITSAVILALVFALVLVVRSVIRIFKDQFLIIPRDWWIWLVLATVSSLLLSYFRYSVIVIISGI